MESPTISQPSRSSFTLNYQPPASTPNQESMSPTTAYYPSTPNHSYYSYRSAPPTPGLLSHHHHTKPLPSTKSKSNIPADLLPRARSTTQLTHPRDPASHRRHQTSALRLTTTSASDSEWVFRAGATIASEVGESKGQSWLSQRASSTSLVRLGEQDSDSDSDEGRGGIKSAGAMEVASPWEIRRRALEADARSRTQSRAGSRMASRAQSTRGSRSSSRADLEGLQGMTPGRMTSAVEDYFGAAARGNTTNDNVMEDEPDESYQLEEKERRVHEDEAEVAKLTGGKSLGLGSWVDGFVNWMLYDDVEEERLRLEKNKIKERNPYLGVIGSGLMPGERTISTDDDDDEAEAANAREGGILNDAAWLIGVASKIIF